MKKLFAMLLVCILLLPCLAVFAETVIEPVPNFKINLTEIILAFLSLLGTLITTKLIPWIKANTDEKQQRILTALVSTLVFAAEQLYGAGRGTEKMQFVKAQLQKRGFDIDIEEIEAAVQELTMQQLSLEPPNPTLPETEYREQ